MYIIQTLLSLLLSTFSALEPVSFCLNSNTDKCYGWHFFPMTLYLNIINNTLSVVVYLHGSYLHFQPASPILSHDEKQLPWKYMQWIELDERKFHKIDCIAQEKSIWLYLLTGGNSQAQHSYMMCKEVLFWVLWTSFWKVSISYPESQNLLRSTKDPQMPSL